MFSFCTEKKSVAVTNIFSKIKVKRKVGRPRKHTVFLKSDVTIGYNNKDVGEIGYSNESMKEVGHNNKSLENICYNSKNKKDINYKNRKKIGYSNNSIEEFGHINHSIEENGYSNTSVEEIGYETKIMEDNGCNENFLKNNYNCTNVNDESNLEYDSDTPISRLSKEYRDNKERSLIENDKPELDVLNESIKVICKGNIYSTDIING